MIEAATISDIQEAVRGHDRIRVVAGGTKDALSAGANMSLAALAGVLEYEPSEYTFTALAGTKVSEIEEMLAERGQYLPFDPLFAASGATLGGTVAAATSGPGRLRYGGVRDFLLGVRFVNGEGDVVFGGGKVVKNAAGFDLPKLMIGALGEFGVLCELTFKVFPRPEQFVSVSFELSDLSTAVATIAQLARSPLECFSLEFEPPTRLWVRFGGLADALAVRCGRLGELLGTDVEVNEVAEQSWQRFVECQWVPDDCRLVRVPISLSNVAEVEQALKQADTNVRRRYGVAGNIAYIAWPDSREQGELEDLLEKLGLSGCVLRGQCDDPTMGRRAPDLFGQRLRSVLDPDGKFVIGQLTAS
ncbi:MAG: FAD-binding protein [Pirellulales bacterium]|nr:FAD-binding protein [Pirellulales bacterium]